MFWFELPFPPPNCIGLGVYCVGSNDTGVGEGGLSGLEGCAEGKGWANGLELSGIWLLWREENQWV